MLTISSSNHYCISMITSLVVSMVTVHLRMRPVDQSNPKTLFPSSSAVTYWQIELQEGAVAGRFPSSSAVTYWQIELQEGAVAGRFPSSSAVTYWQIELQEGAVAGRFPSSSAVTYWQIELQEGAVAGRNWCIDRTLEMRCTQCNVGFTA